MRAIGLLVVACLAAASMSTSEAAGENGRKLEPVLAPDPKVMQVLAGLGDNSTAVLENGRIVGEFNALSKQFRLDTRGPGGRDFSIKMVWAPERGRALFCGANHGVPHRMNDAWEHDLASNTWVMLYAPDWNDRHVKDFSNAVVKDGSLQTKSGGGPVHVAHTWWGLTYDPGLKAMLWMCSWPGGAKSKVEKMGGDVSKLYKGPPLWAFFPETRKWKQLMAPPPCPRGGVAGMLEYVPELGGTVWYASRVGACWLYDSKANKWKNLNVKWGANSRPAGEQVAAWDSVNKLLVTHCGPGKKGGKRTSHYSPATNSWELAFSAPREDMNAPRGHDAGTPMYYDPHNQVCIIYSQAKYSRGGKDNSPTCLWAYSVKTKKWEKLSPKGPAAPKTRKGRLPKLGYFNPEHNVLVLTRGTTAWLYRYKRRGK